MKRKNLLIICILLICTSCSSENDMETSKENIVDADKNINETVDFISNDGENEKTLESNEINVIDINLENAGSFEHAFTTLSFEAGKITESNIEMDFNVGSVYYVDETTLIYIVSYYNKLEDGSNSQFPNKTEYRIRDINSNEEKIILETSTHYFGTKSYIENNCLIVMHLGPDGYTRYSVNLSTEEVTINDPLPFTEHEVVYQKTNLVELGYKGVIPEAISEKVSVKNNISGIVNEFWFEDAKIISYTYNDDYVAIFTIDINQDIYLNIYDFFTEEINSVLVNDIYEDNLSKDIYIYDNLICWRKQDNSKSVIYLFDLKSETISVIGNNDEYSIRQLLIKDNEVYFLASCLSEEYDSLYRVDLSTNKIKKAIITEEALSLYLNQDKAVVLTIEIDDNAQKILIIGN